MEKYRMKRWEMKFILIGAIIIANFLLLKSIFMALPARAEVAPISEKGGTIKDWLISVNGSDTGFSIIDPETGDVHGPFLAGELGSYGGANFDVAVTPDGKTALISNFGDRTVYFVDVSDPLNPSMMYSTTLPYNAEDIDITPDGKFALVTDGGLTPYISAIDIISHTLVYTNYTGLWSNQSVAIGPDSTVVSADYFRGDLNSHLILPTGEVTYTIPYTNPYLGQFRTRPVNVAIAPDGQTVIAATTVSDAIPIYQITAPGVLTFKNFVEGVPEGSQSIAFNDAGDKAYVLSKGIEDEVTYEYSPNRISVLDILGPGQVQLNTASAAETESHGSSQLFGVDNLVVYGNYLFANNITKSNAVSDTVMVNLTDYTTRTIFTGYFPVGIDVIYQQRPLTVQLTGGGTGMVQSLPAGIDCGTTCSADFNRQYFHDVVTLTATADPNMLFTGWSGDCSGTDDCVIDLTEARAYTVTAEFSHKYQWLPYVSFLYEVTTNTVKTLH